MASIEAPVRHRRVSERAFGTQTVAGRRPPVARGVPSKLLPPPRPATRLTEGRSGYPRSEARIYPDGIYGPDLAIAVDSGS